MSEKIQGTNSTNYNYYAYDELGSTLYLTDNNGYVTDKYSYDSWGNLTSQTGTTQQPFKYVGKYGYFAHYMDTTVLPYDVLTTQTLSASSSRLSFLQTGVRTYFPRLGRYMQVDPIKDGSNWSAYTGDNPVNAYDPDGYKIRMIAKLSKGEKIKCTDWSTDPSAWAIAVPGILSIYIEALAIKKIQIIIAIATVSNICKPTWTRICSGIFDIQYYDVTQTVDPAYSSITPTNFIKRIPKTIVQIKMQKKQPSNKIPCISEFYPSEGLF